MKIRKNIPDLVPPGSHRGDELPPDSVERREKIRHLESMGFTIEQIKSIKGFEWMDQEHNQRRSRIM